MKLEPMTDEQIDSIWQNTDTGDVSMDGRSLARAVEAHLLAQWQAAIAEQPVPPVVAWCELTAAGNIAYFDGKPMIMCGPVGNEHHSHALYAHPPKEAEPAPQVVQELRADGKLVPVRRWEIGIRRIVALLWGNRQEFEVDDVVEAVRKLIPEPNDDDDSLVQAVLSTEASKPVRYTPGGIPRFKPVQAEAPRTNLDSNMDDPNLHAYGDHYPNATEDILRDVCELEPANPDLNDTICIDISGLKIILDRHLTATKQAEAPSHTATELAALILSDCGHSTEISDQLLNRVAARIDGYATQQEAQPQAEPVTFKQRLDELIEQHGSLRAVGRVLEFDAGYLSRLASGERSEPGDALLRRMGLREVTSYVRAAQQATGEQP